MFVGCTSRHWFFNFVWCFHMNFIMDHSFLFFLCSCRFDCKSWYGDDEFKDSWIKFLEVKKKKETPLPHDLVLLVCNQKAKWPLYFTTFKKSFKLLCNHVMNVIQLSNWIWMVKWEKFLLELLHLPYKLISYY